MTGKEQERILNLSKRQNRVRCSYRLRFFASFEIISGPSVHNTRARTARNTTKNEEQVASKRFQNLIGMLHLQISQHRNGTIFQHPIKPSEAPDYNDIVKFPIDLKTIKNKVRDGMISNSLEFQRDIYLMFANAMMYNRPGSDVYAMAEDVRVNLLFWLPY
jgi:bromodomain-containing protein 8